MSLSELPSRDELRRATDPWWARSALQEQLIDVLRGAEADLDEARAFAQRVAERGSAKTFIARDWIQEQFDVLRAYRRWQAMRDQPLEKFDPWKCVFIKGVRCPNCGETHGELVGPAS